MALVSMQNKKKTSVFGKASGHTGIPKAVQAKFETASGFSFDDVRVHYNSSRPAGLGALAYTQGTQVYLGPGQERHLEHELVHVIQQKQGIVKANGYLNGLPVNHDPVLERAADLGAAQSFRTVGNRQSKEASIQMCGGGRRRWGFLKWLNRGANNNAVYFGIQNRRPAYTGITNQPLEARLQQHRQRGRRFSSLRLQYNHLTRNQARALEQYHIVNGPNRLNRVGSISRVHRYFQDAMRWAEDFLRGRGVIH